MIGQSNDPSTYLSTSDGRWRVIHHGAQLCADTDLAGARRVAEKYRLDLSGVPVWNGDLGIWEDRK